MPRSLPWGPDCEPEPLLVASDPFFSGQRNHVVSVGGLIAHRRGSPHVQNESPRAHHAYWRRGGVAARGARAAAGPVSASR
jgi:hypothetical protein